MDFGDMMAMVLPGGIERQEAAEQRKMVGEANRLPTDGDWSALEARGVVRGGLVDGDPLFTHCTLPEGWSIQPTDHSMWSKVIDAAGVEVAMVFYKGAFYDRRAHFRATKGAK